MDEKQADALWERTARWAKRLLQVASVLGTVFVMIYFIRIRSVPFDNLAGIAGIAVLIAALSGLFFVALTFMWGFPSLAFRLGLEIDKERICGWFYADRRHAHERLASPARIVLWSLASVALPWIALFAPFAPDAFGGLLGSFIVQESCMVFSATVFAFYALDRPLYPGRERPRLFRGGILLRGVAGPIIAACSMMPLLLFTSLVHLSDYEHTRDNLGVLGLFAVAAAFAMCTNVSAMGHELNYTRPGWRHEVGRIVIPGFFIAAFIGFLGCSGRLQDRIMEIATVRVPHATVVLKESGCQPLRLMGLIERPEKESDGPSLTHASKAKLNHGAAMVRPENAASHVSEGCAVRDVTVLAHAGTHWPVACVDADGVIVGAQLDLRADDVAETLTGEMTRLKPLTDQVTPLCPVAALAPSVSGASTGKDASKPAGDASSPR